MKPKHAFSRAPKALAGALALVACLAWPLGLKAEACGGLFCQVIPVDQAGERILFAADGEEVTAYIQIQYQGDANDFSWIVPVPTRPKITVGADQLFTSLRSLTRPTFTTSQSTEGNCGGPVALSPISAQGNSAGASSGVNVLAQEKVGPYNAVTLEATDTASLRKWLDDNRYTIPPRLDPLLDPYVAGKYLFVAVKLQKTASVGDLRPLVLKYAATKAGIPIRLTGVAATKDMDVYVWVLGKHRSVPENYRHAVINEARIDWLNQGSNYRSVVLEAMNEAGGQAFTTEYAGPGAAVDLGAFAASRFIQLGDLKRVRNANEALFAFRQHPEWFLDPRFASLPGANGLRAGSGQVSASALTALKGVSDHPAVQALRVDANGQLQGEDLSALSNAILNGTQLYEAVANTEEADATEVRRLFGSLTSLTAMYTAMSPEEMTQDPMFVFNPDLPPVKAEHVATMVVRCKAEVSFQNAPRSIELSNGLRYELLPNNPFGPQPTTGQPIALNAALRIEQLKSSGGPSLIQDNQQATADTLQKAGLSGGGAGLGFSGGVPAAVAGAGDNRGGGGFACSGCSNPQSVPPGQGAGEGATFALLAFGALGYRRWAFRKRH